MTPDHDELRRLADLATPGKRWSGGCVVYVSTGDNEGAVLADLAAPISTNGTTPNQVEANTEFIAACDREAILALLDERDALERRVAELEKRLTVPNRIIVRDRYGNRTV